MVSVCVIERKVDESFTKELSLIYVDGNGFIDLTSLITLLKRMVGNIKAQKGAVG